MTAASRPSTGPDQDCGTTTTAAAPSPSSTPVRSASKGCTCAVGTGPPGRSSPASTGSSCRRPPASTASASPSSNRSQATPARGRRAHALEIVSTSRRGRQHPAHRGAEVQLARSRSSAPSCTSARPTAARAARCRPPRRSASRSGPDPIAATAPTMTAASQPEAGLMGLLVDLVAAFGDAEPDRVAPVRPQRRDAHRPAQQGREGLLRRPRGRTMAQIRRWPPARLHPLTTAAPTCPPRSRTSAATAARPVRGWPGARRARPRAGARQRHRAGGCVASPRSSFTGTTSAGSPPSALTIPACSTPSRRELPDSEGDTVRMSAGDASAGRKARVMQPARPLGREISFAAGQARLHRQDPAPGAGIRGPHRLSGLQHEDPAPPRRPPPGRSRCPGQVRGPGPVRGELLHRAGQHRVGVAAVESRCRRSGRR